MDPIITEWAAYKDQYQIMDLLQAEGIPAGPVIDTPDVFYDPQVESRGFLEDVEHPEIGRFKFPATPYKLSRTPWRLEHRAPLLGEHNDEVYGHRLGYSREDLVRMRATGTI